VILIVLGMLAGFFVVPMNALLQQRGSELLTAGRSIAVQGFNENFGMLIMLATYAAFISFHVTLHSLVIGFGALVSIGVLLVIVYSIRIDVGRAPLCRT
jgi:hypothetical protein